MTAGAVIYEVRLRVDAGIAEPFRAWLAEHIEDMLRFDGFETFQAVETESPDPDSTLHIVRYRVAGRRQLQAYLDEHAPRMRAEGVSRFGNRMSATRDIYPASIETARAAEHHCLNCEAPLRGQYCAACGQRDKHRIISLWALLRDVVGDLFEVDSRVWRTTVPLLFKPGYLTSEYLRGRHVRYTPPFRLYLVTSLLFFLIAFIGTEAAFEIDGDDREDMSEAVAELQRELEAARADASENPGQAEALSKVVNDLQRRIDAAESAGAASPDEAAAGSDAAAGEQAGEPGPTVAEGEASDSDDCLDISFGSEPWQLALEERAREVVCEKLAAEGGKKRFASDLVENLPTMMFFFLPVIALIMKLLYPLARRYYVEHLLFFVHYHSFFFLALTISVLVSRLPGAVPGQGVASALLSFGLILYAPIYLFVAMRRVYEQHFLFTAVKFVSLMAAYFTSLLTVFVAVVLFTALSL